MAANRIDVGTAALIADKAYAPPPPPGTTVGGLTYVERYTRQVTGTDGRVYEVVADLYQSTDFLNPQPYLVFRGSVSVNDGLLDERILNNTMTLPTQGDVMAIVNDVVSRYPGQEMSMIGHSLGGYYAQYATNRLMFDNNERARDGLPPVEISAVTFNSLGLSTGFATPPGDANLINFYTYADPATNASLLLGLNFMGRNIALPAGPDAQSVLALGTPALEAIANMLESNLPLPLAAFLSSSSSSLNMWSLMSTLLIMRLPCQRSSRFPTRSSLSLQWGYVMEPHGCTY